MVDITALQRKAIESTYTAICTVYEYRTYKKNGITKQGEKETDIREQPCKLSFESLSTVAQNEHGGVLAQSQKLFLAPELNIKANSKIVVTQNNKTESYSNSGVAAVYPTHQEITLNLFEGWS